MKLKKREITLNEEDSLQDLLYFEEGLKNAYAENERFSVRKEVFHKMEDLLGQTEKEVALLQGLLRKSKEKSL